jgi:O-antigen/teichoic acid export membrane protein
MKVSAISSAKVGAAVAGSIAAPASASPRSGEGRDAAPKPVDHGTARAAYLLYLIANIGPRLATLVLLVVLTRFLPTDEYGLFALVVTAGEILDMASTGWIRIYLLRTEGGAAVLRPRRLGRALALNFGATSFALVAAAFVVPLISREREGDLLLAALAYVVAFALLRLTLTLAQLARCHGIYTAVEMLRALGVVGVTAVTALSHQQSFLGASLAISVTTAASAFIGLGLVTRHIPRPVFPRRGYFEPLAFGLPFVLAATLVYMIGWSDRFILNYFVGQASVAIYVAAYSIARQPVDFFIIALNNFTFPLLMRTYADGGRDHAGPVQSGILTTVCVIGLAMVAGLSLLAGPLAAVLFPPSYRAEVTMLMPWIAAGTFLLSLKQFVFDNSMHVTRQTWLHLVSMLPPAAISLVLGIILIRAQGLPGAATNYVIVSIVAAATSAIISARILPFDLPFRNFVKVALSAAIAAALAWSAREHTAPYGPLAALVAGSAAFVVAYAGVLTLCGISLRRLMETPWAPTD